MTYTTNLSGTLDKAVLPNLRYIQPRRHIEDAQYGLKKEIVDEFLGELTGLSLKVMQEDLADSMSGLQDQLRHASNGVYASDIKAKAQQVLRSPKIEALQATIAFKKRLDSADESRRAQIIADFKKTAEYELIVDRIFELNQYL